MCRLSVLAVILVAFLVSPSFAASGTFKGAKGHITTGSVSVTEQDGKLVIRLGSNFSLDSAPDPYVSLGNGSRRVKGGTAGILTKLKGAGTYTVPANASTKAAREVVIWCKKYAVPLGVATLK